MDIENVTGVIEILDKHFQDNKHKAKRKRQAAALYTSHESSLSISASASNISEIYEALRKSGNSEAMQAFRDTMVAFAQSGKSEDFVHFIHTAEDISQENPQLLEKIFLTVSSIEKHSDESGFSLNSIEWLSNIGYLTMDEIDSYIDTTNHILNYDDTQMGEAFQDFVQTTGTLVKGDSETSDVESYFTQSRQQESGKSFVKFNKTFREDKGK